MWGIGSFAVLLLAAVQTPAAPPQHPGDPVIRRLLDQAERSCPAFPDIDGYSDYARGRVIDYARELAGLDHAIGRECPGRPALAFRIARAVAPLGRGESITAQRLLAELYERGIGVRADPAQALTHRRLFWLLWPYETLPLPFAGNAERDLYLARPETIAILRPYAADPRQPQIQAFARLRLAQALYAQDPGNRAEALALLTAEVPYAPANLLRARIQLESGDAATRPNAVTALSRLSMGGDMAEEARALLVLHARRLLASNPTPEQREEAIRMLAVVAWRLDWAPVQELMAAVREANGGRAPATASDEAASALWRRLAPLVSDDDFPAGAMRADEEGTVRLRALLGPSGRILFTEPVIAGPAQPWILVVAVRRIYLTRPIRPVDLGPDRATPYMWIALPNVRFRIAE